MVEADATAAGSTNAGFASRVGLGWVGSYCKGGLHILSIYHHHSEGRSKRNIDLLQEPARLIDSVVGPWVMAGDFSMLPEEIRTS